MNDSLNSENGPDTQNPQSQTASPGASESSDFQTSAPANVLNEDAGDISVQETGESAAQAQAVEPAPSYAVYYWGGSIILVLVVTFVMLKGMFSSSKAEVPETKPVVAETAAPKKKHATKKKSPPHKRKKKTSKKKR